MIHLDTHVVVWLADRDFRRLTHSALSAIAEQPPRLSPMVMFELQYLHDIGRATISPDAMFTDLAGRIGLTLSETPFVTVVGHARALRWTRDPFDRLIAGAALADNARLVTADQQLLEYLPGAIW